MFPVFFNLEEKGNVLSAYLTHCKYIYWVIETKWCVLGPHDLMSS